MSKFSKFFAAITFAVVSAAATADTYHFNYYYPPGGGTEVWSIPVVDGLRNKGHTVKQEFFKSCHDALSRAKNSRKCICCHEWRRYARYSRRLPGTKRLSYI